MKLSETITNALNLNGIVSLGKNGIWRNYGKPWFGSSGQRTLLSTISREHVCLVASHRMIEVPIRLTSADVRRGTRYGVQG